MLLAENLLYMEYEAVKRICISSLAHSLKLCFMQTILGIDSNVSDECFCCLLVIRINPNFYINALHELYIHRAQKFIYNTKYTFQSFETTLLTCQI